MPELRAEKVDRGTSVASKETGEADRCSCLTRGGTKKRLSSSRCRLACWSSSPAYSRRIAGGARLGREVPSEPVFLPRERGEGAEGETVEAGDGHRRQTVSGDGRCQPHWFASDRAAARGRGCSSHPVR